MDQSSWETSVSWQTFFDFEHSIVVLPRTACLPTTKNFSEEVMIMAWKSCNHFLIQQQKTTSKATTARAFLRGFEWIAVWHSWHENEKKKNFKKETTENIIEKEIKAKFQTWQKMFWGLTSSSVGRGSFLADLFRQVSCQMLVQHTVLVCNMQFLPGCVNFLEQPHARSPFLFPMCSSFGFFFVLCTHIRTGLFFAKTVERHIPPDDRINVHSLQQLTFSSTTEIIKRNRQRLTCETLFQFFTELRACK